MLILDDKYHWQICAKGHSMLHEPGSPYTTCKICNRDIVSSGTINDNAKNSEKQWQRYYKQIRKISKTWIDTHGDDGEILRWEEGTIVTHVDCGGLGVICTCPEGEYEPAESYVKWVVIPDWSIPTKESCPQSVWVGSRNAYFKKAHAIPHSDLWYHSSMKHTAHVLNDEGDIVLTWDPKIREDRENMKQMFATFIEQGYEAYVVNEKPGKLDAMLGAEYVKTKQVFDLDETIGKLIMRKKVVLAPATVHGGYPTPGMNQGRL